MDGGEQAGSARAGGRDPGLETLHRLRQRVPSEHPARPSPLPADRDPAPDPEHAFVIVREIARGGMGIVHEVEDRATGRRIAVKTIAGELLQEPEVLERFQREARLAAAVDHPHCVFVFGACTLAGSPAIAMELMSGGTLDQAARRAGGVTFEQAVRWTLEIVDGLEAAWRAGILHRDVKPLNCFLTADGAVKVGDFGLARPSDDSLHLTRSGAPLGTYAYASPEQLRGRPLDLRSDLYSVGATLYTLLSGRAPFEGKDGGEVMARALAEAPDRLRAARPEIPRPLEAIVARAMHKDASKRYQSYDELRTALGGLLPESYQPARLALRFGAYLLDSLILSLPIYALAAAIGLPGMEVDPDLQVALPSSLWAAFVIDTLLASTLLVLADATWRTTPGKRLFGLRLVSRESAWPGAGRIVVRIALFATGSSLVEYPLILWLGDASVIPMLTLLTILLVTASYRPGFRALHDRLSGVHVGQRRARAARAEDPSTSSSVLFSALDGTDQATGYALRGRLVLPTGQEVLVAYDEALGREVWIDRWAPGDVSVPPGAPRGDSSHGLRVLRRISAPDARADVLESPGGLPLEEFLRNLPATTWPQTRELLIGLARCLSDAAAPLTAAQLWVDRQGRVRLLDSSRTDAAPARTPGDVFADVAACVLERPGGTRGFPLDTPARAESRLTRLLASSQGADLGSVAEQLESLRDIDARVSLVRRIALYGCGAVLPALGAAFWSTEERDTFLAADAAYVLDAQAEADAGGPPADADAQRLRDARLTLAAVSIRMHSESEVELAVEQASEELLAEASQLAQHDFEREQVWSAIRAVLARDPGYARQRAEFAHLLEDDLVRMVPRWRVPSRMFHLGESASLLGFAFVMGIVALLHAAAAALLRGGPGLSLCGLGFRNRRGLRAERWRVGTRVLVSWLLLGALAGGLVWVRPERPASWLFLAASALLFVTQAASVVRNPRQGLLERFLGVALIRR